MIAANTTHPRNVDWLAVSGWEWLAAVALLLAMSAAGVVLVRRLGRLRDATIVVPFGAAFGVALHVVAINALGHFIDVRTAMWLVTVGLVSAATAVEMRSRLASVRRSEPDADDRFFQTTVRRRSLVVVAVLSLFACATSTLATLQVVLYDDTGASHYPSAVMMADGHFPPRDPGQPDIPFGYHYAPDLLAATTLELADLPVLSGYDLQIAWVSLLMLPLAWGVARLVLRVRDDALHPERARIALFVAVAAVWVTGCDWLWLTESPSVREAFANAPSDLRSIPSALVAGALTMKRAAHGASGVSIFIAMHNHSTALGFIGGLGAFGAGSLALLRARRGSAWGTAAAAAVVLLALTALSAETIWVVVGFGLVVTWLLSLVRNARRWPTAIAGAVILVISLVIARIQGGVFTSGGNSEGKADVGAAIGLGGDPLTFVAFLDTKIAELHITDRWFLQSWIPMVVLTVAVLVCAVVRKRFRIEFAALAAMGFGAVVAVFVVEYPQAQQELVRLIFPGWVALSAIVGVAFAWLLAPARRWAVNALGVVVLLGMVGSSLIYQVRHSIFPIEGLRFANWVHEIDFTAPKPTSLAAVMSDDDVEDVTFLRSLPDDELIFSSPFRTLSFIASGRRLQGSYSIPRRDLFARAGTTNSAEDLAELEVRYVYLLAEDIDAASVPLLEAGATEIYRNGSAGDWRAVYDLG